MGCGVDHAHLHLVPLQVDLVSEALADRSIHWEAIPHWSELHQRVPEDRDYLLVSNVDSIAYVANTAPPTSQYFRKLVAKAARNEVTVGLSDLSVCGKRQIYS